MALMLVIAASVSAYAVSSSRLESGESFSASLRNSTPDMPGIRWSTRKSATGVPRRANSRPLRAPRGPTWPSRCGSRRGIRLQVSRHGVQHFCFVIDGQDDGLGHDSDLQGLVGRDDVSGQTHDEPCSALARLERELAVVSVDHDVPGDREP